MWHVRNKQTIESKLIRHTANVVYKTFDLLVVVGATLNTLESGEPKMDNKQAKETPHSKRAKVIGISTLSLFIFYFVRGGRSRFYASTLAKLYAAACNATCK
jgi:hypothetical protein